MALKDFAIVKGEPPLEGGVLVEFWDGAERRTAHVLRTALDDVFDHLYAFRSPAQRVSEADWYSLVQENRGAFERIVEAKYRRALATSDKPVLSIEINFADIQGSNESFTRNALLDAGIASPRTGTRRPSLP